MSAVNVSTRPAASETTFEPRKILPWPLDPLPLPAVPQADGDDGASGDDEEERDGGYGHGV